MSIYIEYKDTDDTYEIILDDTVIAELTHQESVELNDKLNEVLWGLDSIEDDLDDGVWS